MSFANCVACLISAVWLLVAGVHDARAVGWGPTDFLITGAPNFPDRIGVFDQNFAFKGYLDQNFLGVQGMDFDTQGNLVAQASLTSTAEVRVYSPSGARIGGFTSNDSMLQFTGDIKVAPNGNYAWGTFTSGVRVYTPEGAFVTQYGSGDSRGITYVPGNRLWSGGAGTTVTIFDTSTGAQVGSFIANGQTQSYSMQYGTSTDTVLIVDADRDLGGVFERDLTGLLLRQFQRPLSQSSIKSAVRGPNGDVFGTVSQGLNIAHWSPDGRLVETIQVYPAEISTVRVLWAAVVPEPNATMVLMAVGSAFSVLRPARSRARVQV